MGTDVGIVEVFQGLAYFFPSLAQYTTILSPILVFVFSAIGIFSNILPEPGSKYPIPDIEDIESELAGKGKLIYRMVLISRWVMITVNQIIDTKVYYWFHTFTDTCSKFVARLKGEVKAKKLSKITKPKPHQIDIKPIFDTHDDHDNEETK